jgi:polar amino acid transport system substrate-binding protein
MKSHHLPVAAMLGLLVSACAGMDSAPTRGVRQALAPTGKLRVGLYRGGPTSYIPGATPDDARGLGFDLGKELARRIGVPFEPVIYPTAGGVIGGLKSGEWDVAVLALSPERESDLDHTPPFIRIEHGYLVVSGSPISTMVQVDRPGVRIGAPEGGSVNAVLMRTIKNATVVASPGLTAGAEMLKVGRLDVFAANKANLFELSDKLPGSRVLDGRIGVDEITLALPKGRDAGMAYVRQYIEDAKSTGLINVAIQRAGLRGAIN